MGVPSNGRRRRGGTAQYEAHARGVTGTALVRLGHPDAGTNSLRHAVAIADHIGSPAGRWPLHAALADALAGSGQEQAAAEHLAVARGVIDAMARGPATSARPPVPGSPAGSGRHRLGTDESPAVGNCFITTTQRSWAPTFAGRQMHEQRGGDGRPRRERATWAQAAAWSAPQSW